MKSNSSEPAHRELVESSQTPTNFKRLPRLPVELRLQIYDHMIPCPRVMEVLWDPAKGGYYTESKIPVILWVNAEARAHTLKKYSKMFVENVENESNNASTIAQPKPFGAYIDFTQDIFFPNFGGHIETFEPMFSDFFTRFGKDAAARLQYVAINVFGISHNLRRSSREYPLFQMINFRSLSIIFSDICLSVKNEQQIDTAPHYELVKFRTRALDENQGQRWRDKKNFVVTMAVSINLDQRAVYVRLLKEGMKAYGMKNNTTEALEVLHVDSIRDVP